MRHAVIVPGFEVEVRKIPDRQGLAFEAYMQVPQTNPDGTAPAQVSGMLAVALHKREQKELLLQLVLASLGLREGDVIDLVAQCERRARSYPRL